jgi:hypothetical protein
MVPHEYTRADRPRIPRLATWYEMPLLFRAALLGGLASGLTAAVCAISGHALGGIGATLQGLRHPRIWAAGASLFSFGLSISVLMRMRLGLFMYIGTLGCLFCLGPVLIMVGRGRWLPVDFAGGFTVMAVACLYGWLRRGWFGLR